VTVGKVFLVGAGPGDPGLLTQRGAALIESADILVVDDLVNPQIFSHRLIPLIYVGKRGPGSPAGSFRRVAQSGINALLVRLARAGHRVVRLKGGDPLVFGRGGEEMEALKKSGIPYEIVPGVSSATAAPAFAGVPVTDRRWSSQVTFITGHERRADDDEVGRIDWDGLPKKGTLVVLMGVSQWTQIQNRLLKAGWSARERVVAIESATLKQQRIVSSTLGESIKAFRRARLTSPSVIVVGQVNQLHRRLNWLKEKPLLGRVVAVTRAAHQNKALVTALEDRGAQVIHCPSIETKTITDSHEIKSAVQHLSGGGFDWAVFLSENGVKSFAQVWDGRPWPKRTRVCAVGPGTAQAVREAGWPVHRMPEEYSSAGVALVLGGVKGRRILVPRVQTAPHDFVSGLRRKGAHVEEVATYRTLRAPAPPQSIRRHVLANADAITFTSASTVENFISYFSAAERRRLFSRVTALSIGPTTTAALKKMGARKIQQSRRATIEHMVDALVKVFRGSPRS
jgi:uroporphyrinogen III methyltransferase / synthase